MYKSNGEVSFVIVLGLLLLICLSSCRSSLILPSKYVSQNEVYIEFNADSTYQLYNSLLSNREKFRSKGTFTSGDNDTLLLLPYQSSQSLIVLQDSISESKTNETYVNVNVRSNVEGIQGFPENNWYDLYYSFDSSQWYAYEIFDKKLKVENFNSEKVMFQAVVRNGIIAGINNKSLFTEWLPIIPENENKYVLFINTNQLVELNNLNLRFLLKGKSIRLISESDSYFNRTFEKTNSK